MVLRHMSKCAVELCEFAGMSAQTGASKCTPRIGEAHRPSCLLSKTRQYLDLKAKLVYESHGYITTQLPHDAGGDPQIGSEVWELEGVLRRESLFPKIR